MFKNKMEFSIKTIIYSPTRYTVEEESAKKLKNLHNTKFISEETYLL